MVAAFVINLSMDAIANRQGRPLALDTPRLAPEAMSSPDA